MKISTIAARELRPDLAERWVALQRANADLSSPFFHPEFARCVAGVKSNVEIAVAEDGGKPVAFFPFERSLGSLGGPVGGLLSDYHGLVSAGGVDAGADEAVVVGKKTAHPAAERAQLPFKREVPDIRHPLLLLRH